MKKAKYISPESGAQFYSALRVLCGSSLESPDSKIVNVEEEDSWNIFDK